jgi:hypothetical protein
MNILSSKYSSAFLLAGFALTHSVGASEGNAATPIISSHRQAYIGIDKTKMSQNLNDSAEQEKKNMGAEQQLSTNKVPLNATLPADTLDAFGVLNTTDHLGTPENNQANQTFPEDGPVALDETLEKSPFFPLL